MKLNHWVFLILLFSLSCSENVSETKNETEEGKSEITYFIETVQFGKDLQSCFERNIFYQWTDTSMTLHSYSTPFSGEKYSDKHCYAGIDDLHKIKTDQFYKIRIALHGDFSNSGTTYSIEHFTLENETWRRIKNMGSFKVKDRSQDRISPGYQDIDELCEQMVKMLILSTYK